MNLFVYFFNKWLKWFISACLILSTVTVPNRLLFISSGFEDQSYRTQKTDLGVVGGPATRRHPTKTSQGHLLKGEWASASGHCVLWTDIIQRNVVTNVDLSYYKYIRRREGGKAINDYPNLWGRHKMAESLLFPPCWLVLDVNHRELASPIPSELRSNVFVLLSRGRPRVSEAKLNETAWMVSAKQPELPNVHKHVHLKTEDMWKIS